MCLLGSLLFREKNDERACTQLSLGKMREKDGEIEEKRLTERMEERERDGTGREEIYPRP